MASIGRLARAATATTQRKVIDRSGVFIWTLFECVLIESPCSPVGQCLTPEVARALINLRADPSVQARIEELADRCTEGALSPEERLECETYVHAIDFISTLQAQALRVLEANGAS